MSLFEKMDPMVRKLETALSEFKVALANNDLVSAEQFLRSIQSTSDYLADDVGQTTNLNGQNDRILGVNDVFARRTCEAIQQHTGCYRNPATVRWATLAPTELVATSEAGTGVSVSDYPETL